MKHSIFSLPLLLPALTGGLLSLASCDDTQEGCEPGGDGATVLTLWSYGLVNDTQASLRVSTNGPASEVYYLVEPRATARPALALDETAYAQRVLKEGVKLQGYTGGAANTDALVDCQFGDNTLTFVATGAGGPSLRSVDLHVTKWEDTPVDYYFGMFEEYGTGSATLRRNLDEGHEGDYVLVGVTMQGTTFSLDLPALRDENGDPKADEEAGIHYVRVHKQSTFEDAELGQVVVMDVAEWQGSEAYAQPGTGYESYVLDQPDEYGSIAVLALDYKIGDKDYNYTFDYLYPAADGGDSDDGSGDDVAGGDDSDAGDDQGSAGGDSDSDSGSGDDVAAPGE